MLAQIAAMLADGHGWDGHMGWSGGWWMVIWGMFMMAGLVVLVVWVVHATSHRGGTHRSGGDDDPLASARRILAERYAAGELSSDEYRERLEHLG